MIPSGDYILGSTAHIPTRSAIDRAVNDTEGFGLDGSMLSNALNSQGDYVDTSADLTQIIHEHEFGENFIFHKLWIEDIELDAVTTSYDYEFQVWSTHRTDQTITSISGVDPANTAIVEQAPQPFLPTEERYFNLHVEAIGPSRIDAVYTFVTADGEIDNIDVTGYRVAVMSFRPQVPINETWQWLTTIHTSYDTSEQRIKLREEPRQSVRFEVTAKTKQENSALTSALLGWLGNWWAVPAWTEQRLIDSPVTTDDTVIQVDTSKGDFSTGWRVILWQSWDQYEVVNVAEINPGNLVLQNPVLADFPATTIVMPVHLGMMGPECGRSITPKGRTIAALDFKLIDTAMPGEAATYTPATMYQEYEVLTDRNYGLGGTAGQNIIRAMEYLDNGQGIFEVQTRNHAQLGNTLGWQHRTSAEVWAHKTWLATIKGRLKPFWVLTRTPDIELVGEYQDYAETFTINGIGYDRFFQGADHRRDLAFFKKDGTILYRRIVGWTATTITLDQDLGFDNSMADFTMICFMQLVRFASDEVHFNWLRTGRARVALPVMGVDA